MILLSAAFGKPSHSLSCMGYLELERPLFQEYSAVFPHFGADVVVGEGVCVHTLWWSAEFINPVGGELRVSIYKWSSHKLVDLLLSGILILFSLCLVLLLL